MSSLTDQSTAWLASPGGERIPILGKCSIGRSPSNQVVLAEEKVSRRHAIIHAQGEGEFWLVDLGSRNGTLVNDRRVIQPTRLRHGDVICIGGASLMFCQTQAPQDSQTSINERTIAEIRPVHCWLLLADIVDSTHLVNSLPPDELPLVTGRWLAECKQTIEEHGGSINQFLGDGFFAYWRDREPTPAIVARAARALERLQAECRPPFRIVLHFGQVFSGGGATLGEESLTGREIHFVFRMEKLAGNLEEPRLMSEAASLRLGSLLPATDCGAHALAGFDGTSRFLRF